MGRRMACAKRRAEDSSSGRSLRVLRLVSISKTMESGKADSLSNTEIVLGLAVFEQSEVFLFQTSDGRTVLVRNRDEHIDQLDVNLESSLRNSAALALSGPSLFFELLEDAGFDGPSRHLPRVAWAPAHARP